MHMIRNAKTLDSDPYSQASCCFLYGRCEGIFPNSHHMIEEVIGNIHEIPYFFFWYEEGMSESIGLYGEKSVDFFIFINCVRGDLPSDDFTKNGGHDFIIRQKT